MKEILTESSCRLIQVSPISAAEYAKKENILISRINTVMEQRADIESLVGLHNLSMMNDNHANHVRFMASIFKNYNPEVLVETILWVFRAYRSHKFTTNYWAAQINAWIGILEKELSAEAFLEIYPYYEWMQINIPLFVVVSDEKLDSSVSAH
jgi:hypothetical protein